MNSLEYENTQEIKNHGDPHFPFNIYPCSIPLDFSAVPAHWHNDMEIIYIKKGKGIISVDFTSYQVNAGDIVLISPGQLHSIHQFADLTMEYENIIFRITLLLSSGDDLCNEQFFTPLLHNRLDLPIHISQTNPLHDSVTDCLNRIDHLSEPKNALNLLGIKASLLEFFHILLGNNQIHILSKKNSKSLDTVKLILKHVETHYQETLSIQTMADLCGFSCSHFMKFFKQHMGISFTAYLNDYRLTMAAKMLSVSSDTIVGIATETGFENLSYFNRLFKRKYHMTPSQYRK